MAAATSNAHASSLIVSDDYIFIRANEERTEQSERILRAAPLRGTAIWGCGGFSILNWASIKDGITHICAFDINPKFKAFWDSITDIIQNNADHTKAAENIYQIAAEINSAREVEVLRLDVNANLSWLSSAERYNRIRTIFLNKCFSFDQLNVLDLERFSTFIREKNAIAKPHVIYLSNIAACYANQHASEANIHARYENFERSYQMLPLNEAIIIDADFSRDKKNTIISNYAAQRVHLKADLGKIMPPMCICLYGQVLSENNYEKVTDYLKRKAPLVAPDEKSYTPLGLMALKGLTESMRALLAYKANVNAVDGGGMTALHIATIKKQPSAVRLLLENHADVTLTTSECGRTALHYAASLESFEIAEMLVASDPDGKLRKGKKGFIPFKYVPANTTPACRKLRALLSPTTSTTPAQPKKERKAKTVHK